MSDHRRLILGIPVDAVTMPGAVDRAAAFLAGDRLHHIATVNPEFIMLAHADPAFHALLQTTDLNLPDGIGLLWAARRWRRPLPQRVPGSEFVYHLAERAADDGRLLFLLGAAPGVAATAAQRLIDRYPALQIAGTHAGSPDPAEAVAICEKITTARADLLYVAYGAPRQDLWIAAHRDQLPTVRLALGVGGSLDFIAGRARRAPDTVQRLGLEWLYRLIREPWRWRRMLALPRFAWHVLRTPVKTIP